MDDEHVGARLGQGSDLFGKGAARTSRKRVNVSDAREPLIGAEVEKMLDQDAVTREVVLARMFAVAVDGNHDVWVGDLGDFRARLQ